jgi:hypothetical protein
MYKKNISIDVGIIVWMWRLMFKEYVSEKPDKEGSNAYLVSESKSGYMCNKEVYTGKSRPVKNLVFELLGRTAAQ